MTHWQDPAFRKNFRACFGLWEPYVNNYIDSWAWWTLQIWYLPFKIPSMHSEADRWVSQFTLNGIKSNLCRPG